MGRRTGSRSSTLTRQGSRGGTRRTGSRSTVRRPDEGGYSLGGGLGNALGEAQSMIYGFPRGVYEQGKALGDIGTSLQLRKGGVSYDLDEDTKNLGRGIAQSYKDTYTHGFRGLYENPVSVLLDVATVFTLGAGVALKAGALSAKASTRLATAGGRTVEVTRSRKGGRRLTQAGMDAALKRLPPLTPKLGEYARAGRVENRMLERPTRAKRNELIPYDRLARKLSKPERVAAPLRAMYGGDMAAFDRFAATGAPLTARVRALYQSPTPRMAETVDGMRRVAELQKRTLGLADDVAEARVYLPLRLAGGARFVDDELVGGPSVAELKARVAAGEIDEPVYFPHQMRADKGRLAGFVRGATGPVVRPAPLRRNEGVLHEMGTVLLDPMMLGQSFLRSVKYGHAKAVHKNLLENGDTVPFQRARQILAGSGSGKWRIIREDLSQKVPHTVRASEGYGDWLDDLGELARKTDVEGQPVFSLETMFETIGEAEARGAKTVTLVPESYVRQLAGEFTRSSRFAYLLNKYPVRVWRALVLNLRPAWLVNNIIGNSMLYMIGQGDLAGLRSLKGSFQRTWPEHADEMEQVFREMTPEQVAGSFIGTQRPTGFTNRMGKPAQAAGNVVGALATLDKWFETGLRRAATKAELRRHPKVKMWLSARKADQPTLARAAKEALNKTDWDEVSRRVNDSLGDFTHLSPFEKNTLRSIFPFYAWFRAITIITAKLPLEHPLKAQIMARLGEVGAELNLEELGVEGGDVVASLRGMIPLGEQSDGRFPVGVTGSANPFGTVAQTLEGASLAPGALGSILFGQPGTGFESIGEALRPLGASPFLSGGVVSGLPQRKLFDAFSGRAYQGTPSKPTFYDQEAIDALLRYLGLPYARVSTRRAKQIRDKQKG